MQPFLDVVEVNIPVTWDCSVQSCRQNLRPVRGHKLFSSKYGLPSFDNLLFRDNYILSYDNRLKHAVWVVDHVKFKRDSGRNDYSFNFYSDHQIHQRFRSSNRDYINSGYDRGHLSPARQHKTNIDMLEQSYELSNVAPQTPDLNRGVWKILEEYVYSFLPLHSKNVYSVTGTLYDTGDSGYNVIGPNRVGVPTHFYKVIVHESRSKIKGRIIMEAFVMPNAEYSSRSGFSSSSSSTSTGSSSSTSTEEVSSQEDYSEGYSSSVYTDSEEYTDSEGVSSSDNSAISLEEFRIDIDHDLSRLEKDTGLRFFDKLNRDQLTKPSRFIYDFEVL